MPPNFTLAGNLTSVLGQVCDLLSLAIAFGCLFKRSPRQKHSSRLTGGKERSQENITQNLSFPVVSCRMPFSSCIWQSPHPVQDVEQASCRANSLGNEVPQIGYQAFLPLFLHHLKQGMPNTQTRTRPDRSSKGGNVLLRDYIAQVDRGPFATK